MWPSADPCCAPGVARQGPGKSRISNQQGRPGRGVPVGLAVGADGKGRCEVMGVARSEPRESGAGGAGRAAAVWGHRLGGPSSRLPRLPPPKPPTCTTVASPCKGCASPGTHPVPAVLCVLLRAAACVPAPFRSALRGPDRYGDGTHGRRRQDRKASVDPTRRIYVPAQESSDSVS